MSTEITMPKLSDTMTEGRLISWKKSVGDPVARGDIIAEVETDKAVMELEAFASGVLVEIRIRGGEVAPVGTVIGIIGTGNDLDAVREAATTAPRDTIAAVSAPGEQPVTARAAAPVPDVSTKGNEFPAHTPAEEERATPLVRRLARERGIDMHRVTGTGPGGRILVDDLDNQDHREPMASSSLASTAPEAVAPAGGELAANAALSRMRSAIARTVTEAWTTIPHFSVTVAVEMSEAERVRQELSGTGLVVSINGLVIKAAALALHLFPRVNSHFAGERIFSSDSVNIGLAVALDDGLVVPVITGCQLLTLGEIAAASRHLVERARSGKLTEADLAGGTFTVSNLGMFGVDAFSAVIFPGQGAVLAVAAIMDRVVIRHGETAAGRTMNLTLSADHRLLDGAEAARFLAEIKRVLENPVTLLL
jgi:pyruvate dehydrogenase E2 component (dihydrolipoamide acetyltransferase)